MFSPDRYRAALQFAAERHLQQKFPGTELPYLAHVVTVASEVIAHLPALGLADRIANMDAPPHHWTAEKRAEYRDEAFVIADALGAASSVLDARLRSRIAAYPA